MILKLKKDSNFLEGFSSFSIKKSINPKYLGRQAYADNVDKEQIYKGLHVLSFLKHITEIYRYDLSKCLNPLEKNNIGAHAQGHRVIMVALCGVYILRPTISCRK